MNILDENITESQCAQLRNKRIRFRQISHDLGRMGMKDEEIISLLHQLDQPTFFTLDGNFYGHRLCHERYCLVHLDVKEERVAEYVRQLLRHREFNTKAKRMGRVVQVLPTRLHVWDRHEKHEGHLSWQ